MPFPRFVCLCIFKCLPSQTTFFYEKEEESNGGGEVGGREEEKGRPRIKLHDTVTLFVVLSPSLSSGLLLLFTMLIVTFDGVSRVFFLEERRRKKRKIKRDREQRKKTGCVSVLNGIFRASKRASNLCLF